MIYLDHNATSPASTTHLQKLFDILNQTHPANPSSPHALGRTASVLLSQARKQVASALNVDSSEIIFTSGGTEANNLGTRAVIEKKLTTAAVSVITSAFEHPCVIKTLEQLKNKFPAQIELIIISPNSEGYISVSDIISNIKSNTILISLMSANNEIGTIQPVKELGDFLNFKRWGVKQHESTSKSNAHNQQMNSEIEKLSAFLNPEVSKKNLQDLHFHVDAVQTFGKLQPTRWMSQGYDSIALSGHKLGALQGIGALVLRRGRTFAPLNTGGAQEKNRRAGTENIPGIISFGMVCADMQTDAYWHKIDAMQKLTHTLFDELSKSADFVLNSQKECALPNTVHFSLVSPTHRAEDLILNLDLAGICVSSGSACSSGVNLHSPSVLALGKTKQLAANSIRISLGTETTLDDIKILLKQIYSL